MIRVYWENGSHLEANSWGWLLRKLESEPWNWPYRTGREMRNELARRAYVLSGRIIDPTLPAAEFWHALQDAGVVRIFEEEQSWAA